MRLIVRYLTGRLGRAALQLGLVGSLSLVTLIFVVDGIAEAWAVPGDPSELTASTAFNASCSVSWSGTAGVKSSGSGTLSGVCSGRPGLASNDMANWLAAGRDLTDIYAVTWGSGTHLSGSYVSATVGGSGGIVSGFSSAACPGVANCGTYSVTLSFTSGGSAGFRTVDVESDAQWITFAPATGRHGVCGSGGCHSLPAANGAGVYAVEVGTPSYPPRYYWTAPYVTTAPPPDGACDRVTWTWGQSVDYLVSRARPADVGMEWEAGNHVLVYVNYPTIMADFPQWDTEDQAVFKYPTGDIPIPRGYVQLQDVWRRAQPDRVGQLPDFSTVTAFDFDVRPWESFGKFFRASEVRFFCIHLDAVDGQTTGYVTYGDEPGEALPPESSCSLVFIGRPAEVEAGGAATTEVFVFVDRELVDPVTIEYFNPLDETWSEILTDETFPQPWDPSILVDSHDQDAGMLKFRCTDGDGLHTGGYWEGGPEFGGIISNVTDTNCYTQSSFGLNPGSWVPAAGRMGACLAKGLFVPDSDAIAAEWDETYAAMEAAVPFAWVVNAHGLVSDASFGMATAIETAAGECFVWIGDGTAGTSIPESERGVCPGELASGAGVASGWAMFRDLAGKAVWIFWVLALGRVVLSPPSPPEVITEENGQMAWNM